MIMDSHAEILRLRTALRDLVALSSIPAAWVAREPAAIAAGLADVLIGSLQLDFAFVRLCDPSGGAAVEETRGNAWHAFPEWLQRHLAIVRRLTRKEIISHLGGADPCRGIVIPIGVNAEGGLVAAARDRPDFPTEIDQLLLSVAANHAATAFQSARLEQALRQARDELEVKVAERTAELRRSEAYLAEGQRLSHTGTFRWDVSSGDVYCSEETSRIFQYDRTTNLTVDRLARRFHPEDAAFVTQTIERASQDGKDFDHEHRLLMPDGSVKHVHVVAHGLCAEPGSIEFVGAVMDVTAAKEAEAEVRQSERRYRYIFQSTGVSIWEEDFSQVKTAIDEVKAGGVEDFRQYLAAHPEFVERAMSSVRILDVNDASVELFGARDKQELLVSLDKILTPETHDVFAAELIALAEGKTWFESQTPLQTLKGDRLSVLLTIAFPDEPTKLNSVLVSIMDITEQKRAEEALHQTQADLAHVSRVTTLGQMAASIAHEVDQPLSGIIINANACLRFLNSASPNLDEVRDGLQAIGRDGRRANDVIARIRTLARRKAIEKEPLDINEVIREVVALAEGEARRTRASLRTVLAGNLPRVLGDRVQLQQVVLNLLLNGLEAMNAVMGRPRDLVISTQREPTDRVRVAVEDAGSGIDPQFADHIFEAFYSTKGGGMGMGLSISRSIVEQHGGRLWAVPNEGPGTTFHFTV